MSTSNANATTSPVGSFVKGKVVVVTGSGGGIGRDFALALAREGARVVVNDVGASIQGEGSDESRAQAVVDEIKAAGGEAAWAAGIEVLAPDRCWL